MIPTFFSIPLPFNLGALPVHSFGLFMVFCFLTAWRRLQLSLESVGEDPLLAESMITWAAVGGIVGARVFYILTYPNQFLEAPFATMFGGAGFVFYGGFIGGAFAVWVLLRRAGKSYLYFGDLTGPALALGYAVGRVGCQLSGDGDYGMVSDLPWAMGYPFGVVPSQPGELHHPAPVYESLMALLTAVILVSKPVHERLPKVGQLFGLYLFLSGFARAIVEFIRIEPRIAFGLTQAQFIGLGIMAVGLMLIITAKKPRAGCAIQP